MRTREILAQRQTKERINVKNIEAVTYEDFVSQNNIDLEALSVKQLNELLNYKYELEDRQRNFGILYYKPQEYQEAFHKSNKKIRLVVGGNQTGKTEVGVAEDIRLALGIDPHGKFKESDYPLKIRVCATDLNFGIGNVIMPKFEKLLPMSEVKKIEKYSTGQWRKIFFHNGSTIEFLSYEQDTTFYEGWTGHHVHFDEPPPHDKYVATIRGLMRYNGTVAITATPLNEPWIYDEIYLKCAQGSKEIDVFEFSLFDNKYLTEEAKQSFIEKIPEEERDARVSGKFKHLTGVIYKEFGEIHRVDSFKIPENWLRICAMDYHPRKACVIVWVAIDEKDTAYVYDELASQGTIAQISEKIAAKEQEHGGRVRFRFIDSISATPDRISGKCPQREFAAEGNKLNHPLLFRSSVKSWVLGKNAVSEYMKIVNDVPAIYFFRDKCPKLIESLTKYTWATANTNEANSDRPRKLYDDFPDALRYALVLKIKYIAPDINPALADYESENRSGQTGYNLGR